MFKAEIEALERQYGAMGELLLGSVRPFTVGGWHWLHQEANCVYMRNPKTGSGLLGVFDRLEDGGVSGKQFYFNSDTLLSAFDVALSQNELRESGIGQYVIDLCMLELSFDPEREVAPADEAIFWQVLEAPLLEV